MRRRALALALLTVSVAACSDASTSTAPLTEDPRLAMAAESRSTAIAFASQADSAEQAGDVYRPLLLRALVDALQFGSPFDTATIQLDGQAMLFNVTVMNAQMLRTDDVTTVTEGFVLAWNGPNAERIFVTSVPPGNTGGRTVALYLNGGDTLMVGSATSSQFDWTSGSVNCVYDDATQLAGPTSYACLEGSAVAALTVSFTVANPPYTTIITFPQRTLGGVSVLRHEADLLAARATDGVMSLMAR